MKRQVHDTGLSVIVKMVACVLAIPLAAFGFYVALHGHLIPGGGFAGGAIIATITALFLVAFGREVIKSQHSKSFSSLRTIKSVGIAIFGILVFISLSATFLHQLLTTSGWFFKDSVPFGPNSGSLGTGGVIPLMNLAVGFEVAMALSLAVVLLLVSSKERRDAVVEGEGK